MIAEGGLAALWIAAAMALVQLVLGSGAAKSGSEGLILAVRKIAIVQGVLALIAFAMLIMLFVNSDMSVVLVATNSHSAKPLIYKIAGAWGNG